MSHRGRCTRCNSRRQRRCKDETTGETAEEVAELGRGRNIAANHPKRLTQSALNYGNAMHETFLLCNAPTPRTIEPHCMNLIQIGHCVVFLSQITNFSNWSNITIHGVDAFKGNQLRTIQRLRSQFGLKIDQIIMFPNLSFRFRMANAFNHRRVIQSIGQHQAVRNTRRQSAKCRPV